MIRTTHSVNQQAAADFRRRSMRALMRATDLLHKQLILVLSVPNTGKRRRRKYGRKGSYTVYPNPSKPGEAPRKRTGFLQRNVKYDFDRQKISARIGVTQNAKYGMYLELKMNRPWLAVTAERLMPQMVEMMREEIARG